MGRLLFFKYKLSFLFDFYCKKGILFGSCLVDHILAITLNDLALCIDDNDNHITRLSQMLFSTFFCKHQ